MDQYDAKHGADQLAELEKELGPLPVTITNTSRGADSPSRQHFFLLPENVELVAKAAPDIDILQHGHRYAVAAPSNHPDTGNPYTWYDSEGAPIDGIPDIGDFEMLPDAWLERLRAPEAAVHGGFDGEVQEWMDSLIQGEPDGLVRSMLRAVPSTDFDHDEMIRLVFHAVRLGAELHPGVPQYVEAIYREWLRPPYDTDAYRKDIDMALTGAIRKAGALEDPVPELMPGAEALSLLPEFSPNGTEFVSMLSEVPQSFDEYEHTEARRILIREILSADIPGQAALTIVWNSRLGEDFRKDKYGVEKLWREVMLVKSFPVTATLAVNETVEPAPERTGSGVKFLTDAEYAYLQDQGDWFGTHYLDWVRRRVPVFNGPYHRMALWLVLSLVFSEQGHTRTPSKKHNLSLYGMTLGQSTTGKTESFDLAEQVLDAYYRKDDSPYVGNLSKMSPNGLHRALLMRDGRSSLVRSDEAQGLLSQVKGDSWQNALLPDLADYYEGRVRPMQKTGDREASGMSATGNVVAHLTGIEHDVFENLEIPQWKSGLLLRFVWAIGDPYDESGENFEERQFEGEDGEDFDMMPKQWAAEFSAARAMNEAIGPNRFVRYDEDALDRHTELNRQVTAVIRPHRRYEEVLRGAKTRFMMSVRKAATIVALCEASETVTLRHELIAVAQAEEWLGSMIKALDRTAETQFERETEEVYKMVVKEPGAELPKDAVYKAFKPMERADRILRQLAAENRVEEKHYKERGHVLVARVTA